MDLSAINPILFVAGFLVAATPLILGSPPAGGCAIRICSCGPSATFRAASSSSTLETTLQYIR